MGVAIIEQPNRDLEMRTQYDDLRRRWQQACDDAAAALKRAEQAVARSRAFNRIRPDTRARKVTSR
jgi:hypothetical protein